MTLETMMAAASSGPRRRSSDGFNAYPAVFAKHFGGAVDYGVAVKNYRTGSQRGPDHRYEPPRDPFTLFVWEVLSGHSTPRKRDAALASLKRARALTPKGESAEEFGDKFLREAVHEQFLPRTERGNGRASNGGILAAMPRETPVPGEATAHSRQQKAAKWKIKKGK